jgi:hypothetical protein
MISTQTGGGSDAFIDRRHMHFAGRGLVSLCVTSADADDPATDSDHDCEVHRRPLHYRGGGAEPLPDRQGGLGKYQVEDLPRVWKQLLRQDEAGRVHVSEGKRAKRLPRCQK